MTCTLLVTVITYILTLRHVRYTASFYFCNSFVKKTPFILTICSRLLQSLLLIIAIYKKKLLQKQNGAVLHARSVVRLDCFSYFVDCCIDRSMQPTTSTDWFLLIHRLIDRLTY